MNLHCFYWLVFEYLFAGCIWGTRESVSFESNREYLSSEFPLKLSISLHFLVRWYPKILISEFLALNKGLMLNGDSECTIKCNSNANVGFLKTLQVFGIDTQIQFWGYNVFNYIYPYVIKLAGSHFSFT